MNTNKIEKFLNNFGLHILTVVAGLVLLFNPDGATALVSKLIGWILVISCAVRLISLAVGNQLRWGIGAFVTGAILCVGVILLAKPMLLTDSLSRFFGIWLVIEGIDSFRKGGAGLRSILTIVAGAVLVVLPRTLTQTVLGLCGIIMLVIGVVNILGKLGDLKRLEAGKDPNIIDADM